ncbi:retrovirus-related pol polyprotein from transposon TNT 1-94 [Tanacetum coccineum]
MTLLNHDIFYLPKKYVQSLHKYHAIPFPKNDLEALTSRWYLHKNDIEDLYPMCINGKIKDYQETRLLQSLIIFIRSYFICDKVHEYQLGMESYQQRVNLTASTITFPGIKRNKVLIITSKLVVGLIYENSKKEKRAMIIKEIPKLCDATLIRVLKLVKKKNMNVKHGCYNCQRVGHYARNCIERPKRRDVAYLQTQLLIAQKKEIRIQLQAVEFDLMVADVDSQEIKVVNANYILMANLQQASILGTLADKAPIYDSNGSAKDDNNVIPMDSSMDPSGGDLEQHPVTIKKNHDFYESLYNNLVIEVEKVIMVNHKTREVNEKLTVELTRYKGQEKHKHDPPVVYDSEETIQLAQESSLKMTQHDNEIKPTNYEKINKLFKVFVSQKAKSQEEVEFFEGWKPLSPLQLAVEEVMSE